MEEEFDVVILGAGLKQYVLAGILSALSDKKVLLVDQQGYHGGSGRALQAQEFFEYFGNVNCDISRYGNPCSWNVDTVPKLLVSNGALVSVLVKTGAVKFLKFMVISSKLEFRAGRLWRSSDIEIDVQDLLGDSVLRNCDISSQSDSAGEQGDSPGSADEGWEHNRRYSFTYAYPYIYPLYGQQSLLRAFSSLSADKGGRIVSGQSYGGVEIGENGEVNGVYYSDSYIKCKHVISDPFFFPNKCRKVGQVVRAVCLLRAAIPDTNNTKSCQIRIPHTQVGRKSDIYIVLLSSDHKVCDSSWHVATLSTVVETNNPEQELEAGFELLGCISEKFVFVSDLYEPTENDSKDNIFVCKSEGASPQCDTVAQDIIKIYEEITGEIWEDFSSEGCPLESDLGGLGDTSDYCVQENKL